MVENGYRQLSEHNRRTGFPSPRHKTKNPARFGQTGWPRYFLFTGDYRCFVSTGLFAGSAGRANVSAVGLDENAGRWFLLGAGDYSGPGSDASFHPGTAPPGSSESSFPPDAGTLPSGSAPVPALSEDDTRSQPNIFSFLLCPYALKIGSQFMPPLFEGLRSLYAVCFAWEISIGQASQLLQEQDRIIRTFPEVETVFGTIGRSDSATDNAPLDMYDTTIMLKPRSAWRPGMTYDKFIQEMDSKLQFPGLSTTWTMPVENRLDMELTGIKTPLGMKIQGPSLEGIQKVAAQLQLVLTSLPDVRSIFAERVFAGFFTSILKSIGRRQLVMGLPSRRAADRHFGNRRRNGDRKISKAVSGTRSNVRYNRDFRDNVEELRTSPYCYPGRRANSHQRSGEDFVLARALHDP